MPKKKKKFKKGVVILLFLFTITIICLLIYYGLGKKIRNIYIKNNNILSDQTIIEIAKLQNYPNFYTTTTKKIEKNLESNPYIKKAKVRKGILSIYIDVSEYRPLFIREDNKTIVLENMKEISYDEENLNIPILINYVPDTKYEYFIKKYIEIDEEVTKKISEIKYYPNEYDEDRFLLYMNDENYVYVTLTKFDILEKYNDTVKKLDGKKGILYLDSGNYFEIKE